MKVSRRQAILGTLTVGAAVAILLGSKKLLRVYATPDLTQLKTSKQTLNALVEAIIPKSADAPGATDTSTTEYVIQAVQHCLDQKTQNNFLHGLNSISDRAQNLYGITIPECSLAQRVELLTVVENESGAVQSLRKRIERKLLGDDFIFTLKRLTVWGYCTSELGATTGLRYDYIPSHFEGDIILNSGQKSWATS